MSARDEAHESVNPSAQRGGATPAERGGSDAPKEMLAEDPQLGSSVLGVRTGSDDDDKEPELTREGLLGALAGKAKEAVGELVGNEDLARSGRVQQAEINADAEAVREADQD